MTDQPRDLENEVELAPDSTIAAIVKQLRDAGKPWADIDVDIRNGMTADWRTRIEHYAGLQLAALSRELEEHREALAWVLDNGAVKVVHFIDRKPHARLANNGDYDSIEPPAHLAPILAEAMKVK